MNSSGAFWATKASRRPSTSIAAWRRRKRVRFSPTSSATVFKLRPDMDIRLRQPVPVSCSRSHGRHPGGTGEKPRSLKLTEWPEADRLAWAKACEPAQRLQRGGAAGHLAAVSKADIANRYGLYLDFLQRTGRLG